MPRRSGRLVVPFDAELRRLTEETALTFGELFAIGRTPAAVWRAERCRACSLLELLPAEGHRQVGNRLSRPCHRGDARRRDGRRG